MTGEKMLSAIGFEKERYNGFDYYDNREYGITIFDNGCVKIDCVKKPVIVPPIIMEAVYRILKEGGVFETVTVK